MAKWNLNNNFIEYKVKTEDAVNSPSHYGNGKIECIEYIKDTLTTEEFRGYCRGNVIKYQHRHRYKGKALEDLQKAEYYLKALIDTYKEEGPP